MKAVLLLWEYSTHLLTGFTRQTYVSLWKNQTVSHSVGVMPVYVT